MKKIQPFATYNDSDKWVIIVDNYFGYFDNEEKANEIYNLVGGTEESDGLAETLFCNCEILPPNYCPKNYKVKCSDCIAIDIVNYIKKTQERVGYRLWLFENKERNSLTLKQRYKGILCDLFDN